MCCAQVASGRRSRLTEAFRITSRISSRLPERDREALKPRQSRSFLRSRKDSSMLIRREHWSIIVSGLAFGNAGEQPRPLRRRLWAAGAPGLSVWLPLLPCSARSGSSLSPTQGYLLRLEPRPLRKCRERGSLPCRPPPWANTPNPGASMKRSGERSRNPYQQMLRRGCYRFHRRPEGREPNRH